MCRNIMFLGENMAVTTLSQMPHTEIDDSFKSEFCLPHLQKSLVRAMEINYK